MVSASLFNYWDGRDRRDDFDQYLKRYVEDRPRCVEQLATGGKLDEAERAAVAMFIAALPLPAHPGMGRTLEAYLSGLCEKTRTELDILVRHWCEWTRQPYGDKAYNEFLKPSMPSERFGAIRKPAARCCNGSGAWSRR